jgi:hypothetical protein
MRGQIACHNPASFCPFSGTKRASVKPLICGSKLLVSCPLLGLALCLTEREPTPMSASPNTGPNAPHSVQFVLYAVIARNLRRSWAEFAIATAKPQRISSVFSFFYRAISHGWAF